MCSTLSCQMMKWQRLQHCQLSESAIECIGRQLVESRTRRVIALAIH